MIFTFDIINILVTIAGTLSLIYGLVVYSRGITSISNRSFFWFALSVALWSFAMVFFRSSQTTYLLIFAAHLLYIFAAIIPLTFLNFVSFFETENYVPKKRNFILISIGFIFIIIAVLPNILIKTASLRINAEPYIYFNQLIHAAYFVYIVSYGLIGFYILINRYGKSDIIFRNRFIYVMWGTFIPLSVSIITNLLLPFFGIFTFNWVGQISTFAMTTIIIYGIFKEKLFNVRVLTAEILMFLMWIVALGHIVLSENITQALFNSAAFILFIFVGIILMRSVYKEVEIREKVEILVQDLKLVNSQQEDLLHFISHEIKGYLTKSQNAFAAIVEGDYGPVSNDIKHLSLLGLNDTRSGVAVVMNILDAANFSRGGVAFDSKQFDLKKVLLECIEEATQSIKEKLLIVEKDIPVDESFLVIGDESKIKHHIISNLLDNAIRYTSHGAIHIRLSRTDTKAQISIEDNGVGIDTDDMAKLFTKGGRGKDSTKINVHSTGYGLYIAKMVTDAHKGRIWAESDGMGKGSRFVVELPLSS